MASQTIEYVAPTARAFERMKQILFAPFSVGKWFVLGFSAWLASLLDGGGGGGGGVDFHAESNSGNMNFRFGWWSDVGDWMQSNMEWIILIGLILFFLGMVIWVALLWVSSRGKLMFLDNVVHNRAEIRAPWKNLKTVADSLFLWRLVFNLSVFVLILIILGIAGGTAYSLRGAEEMILVPLVLGALVLFVLIIAVLYVATLLENFVIPIMYRNQISTSEAWRVFGKIHRDSLGNIILFVLWSILLLVGATVCIFALGFATCCVGFAIMAIPYLGTVLLLPVPVFFRCLGPEFLKQFGDEYDILSSLSPPLPVPSDGLT